MDMARRRRARNTVHPYPKAKAMARNVMARPLDDDCPCMVDWKKARGDRTIETAAESVYVCRDDWGKYIPGV